MQDEVNGNSFTMCSWCNDFLKDPEDNFQEGICRTCFVELGEIPNLVIDNISREFVDSLPFGNIVIDPQNKVVRYNATEAKYTGYDSSQIEGKHFFNEVAPCTNVDGFYGILRKFRIKGKNNQHLFKFTFNHANFKSLVSILMTYYENGYAILSIKKIRDL